MPDQWKAAPKEQWQLWDAFLSAWPRARLHSMSLDEYTSSGDKNSFCNWLETGSDQLGSIWGGSAFKFGIYSRKSDERKPSGRGIAYSMTHGWYSKYGDTAEVAFAKIKDIVCRIADAAAERRFDEVDAIEFGNALKWKIAFIYQPQENSFLLPVYKKVYLATYLGDEWKSRSQPELYAELLRRRKEQDVFSFGTQVFNAAMDKISALKFTSDVAFEYLTDRYGLWRNPTEKLAGFLSPSGRALALNRERPNVVSLFVEPGSWSMPGVTVKRAYAASDPRHSNLSAQAPELAIGRPMAVIEVSTLPALEALCAAYDSDVEKIIEAGTEEMKLRNIPLNQILYGPPGTGKTFSTIERALEILDPELIAKRLGEDRRRKLKARFDELHAEGRVQFVTFHQSFSYEDFVEGIRAEEKDGKLVYGVESGIFRNICDQAAARLVKKSAETVDPSGRRIWKMSLGNTLEDDDEIFHECLENNYILLGWGGDVDFNGAKSRKDVHDRFLENGKSYESSDYAVTAVNLFCNRMRPRDLVVISDGNHKFRAIAEVVGDYRFLELDDREGYRQCRDVKWHRVYTPSQPREVLMNKVFSQATLYEIKPSSIDADKLRRVLSFVDGESVAESNSEGDNWVLIIDEINRGNVSRIFGELITLIEPDKRAEMEEELSVVLPYSRERFSVPSNLYIVGTMNTADRSLASLDIALRRRFVFEEVPPDPTVLDGINVDGIDIGKILEVMNLRIEALLDRDHRIGHSYFIPLRDDATILRLAEIFERQIIPLLQEYFFENWERIHWVLNDHNKPAGNQFVSRAIHDVNSLFGLSEGVAIRNGQWTLNRSALMSVESYQGILLERS